MSRNFETFRSLLRGAICTRTQAQFANDSGISAEHLNRMLNMDNICRPSKKTLQKIASAAKNGITFQDLKDALDKDDPNSVSPEDRAAKMAQAAEDFRPEFPELAEEAMKALCASIKSQTYPVIVDSLAEHMDALISAADIPGSVVFPVISYELGIERPYPGKHYVGATRYVRVDLSMADYQYAAMSDLILYFMELPCREGITKYVIYGASCSVEDIMELFGMPPAALAEHEGENALEEAMKDPFYLEIRETEAFEEEAPPPSPNKSKEQRLLRAIFGGKEVRYPVVTEGVGFSLKETPPNLLNFFLAHRESLLSPYRPEPENYDSISAALDEMANTQELQPFLDKLDALHYTDENTDNDLGWPAAIAVIIFEETGFPFLYMKKSEDKDGKFPFLSQYSVIILPDTEAEKLSIQREAILLATSRYVRELGLKRFGDLLFTNMVTKFRNPRTYVVKDIPESEGKEEEEPGRKDEDYSVAFDSGVRPEESGLYAVKLKDGRRMKLVYIPSHNSWIRLHREWSDLIESYCPTPLPLPKPDNQENNPS